MQEGTCFAHSSFFVHVNGSWIKNCEAVILIHSTTTLNTLVPDAKALRKGN